MREYTTDNKKIVTAFFEKNRDSHYTIDSAIDELHKEGYDIAKSSLYRTVGNLCRTGILKRFEADGIDSFVYQYSNFDTMCEMHFHLKCSRCGKLIHLECPQMNDIKKHIFNEHGFTIGGGNIIYGLCKSCSSRSEK